MHKPDTIYTTFDGEEIVPSNGYLRDDIDDTTEALHEVDSDRMIMASLEDGYCDDEIVITPNELSEFLRFKEMHEQGFANSEQSDEGEDPYSMDVDYEEDVDYEDDPIYDMTSGFVEINLVAFLRFKEMCEQGFVNLGNANSEQSDEDENPYSMDADHEEDVCCEDDPYENLYDQYDDAPLSHGKVRCAANKGKIRGKEKRPNTVKASGILPHYVYRHGDRVIGRNMYRNFSPRDGARFDAEQKKLHMIKMILLAREGMGRENFASEELNDNDEADQYRKNGPRIIHRTRKLSRNICDGNPTSLSPQSPPDHLLQQTPLPQFHHATYLIPSSLFCCVPRSVR